MEKDTCIDSLDVIERIAELEYTLEEGGTLDAAETVELRELLELQKQAESSPDWIDGETLIRSDYFLEYTKDLIDDSYEMPKGVDMSAWPYRHMRIDYDAAADELSDDYMEVKFGDVEYMIRA